MATVGSHRRCQITFGTTYGQTLSLLHKNQTKTTSSPPLPPPLQPLLPRDSTVTVTVTAATTAQPGLCPLRETQAEVWQREEGKGDFLRHNSLGFPYRGMGVLVGAAPGPGWAVDPTKERGTEGATRGKRGEHPLGRISPEGSSRFGALEAEPPRDAEGRRGAGTSCSTPPQIPALNHHKPNNVTPRDAPIPLRAKPQHSSWATRSPQATGSSQAMDPLRPCSAPAPARSSSRHFSRAAPSLFGHFLTRDSGPWGQAGTAQVGTAPLAPLLLPEQKQLLLEGKESEEGGTAQGQAVTGHCQPCWAHWHQPRCRQLLLARGSWE